MTITPVYGGLAALLFAFLSLRVIRLRGTARVSLGFADDRPLQRAIRAHGNFAEYVPLVLLLMAFAELQHAPDWRIQLIGVLLLSGRVIHAAGLMREPEPPNLRIVGMVLTLAALISGGVVNLVGAL